jgi:hypothetical protein
MFVWVHGPETGGGGKEGEGRYTTTKRPSPPLGVCGRLRKATTSGTTMTLPLAGMTDPATVSQSVSHRFIIADSRTSSNTQRCRLTMALTCNAGCLRFRFKTHCDPDGLRQANAKMRWTSSGALPRINWKGAQIIHSWKSGLILLHVYTARLV